MKKANNSMMVGSSSWLEQFTEAFVVQAGKNLELTFLEINRKLEDDGA